MRLRSGGDGVGRGGGAGKRKSKSPPDKPVFLTGLYENDRASLQGEKCPFLMEWTARQCSW